MTRLFRIALLGAVCAALVVLQAGAADTGRKFSGTSTCGKMKVEVSFTYDVASRQIHDFYGEHRCTQGGHAIGFMGATIEVKADGTFNYRDENGATVEGRIDGDAASGEFGRINTSLRCADEQFHEPCTAWKAKAE